MNKPLSLVLAALCCVSAPTGRGGVPPPPALTNASAAPALTNAPAPAVAKNRMIVMPFRLGGSAVTVYGKKILPGLYCENLGQKVNDALTQTRRFTMLNREFDADIRAELSRLALTNSAPGDVVRLKKLLVTDYLVTGSLKMFDSPAVSSNPYTGSVRASDGPFLEVSYRLIHVPTSRQPWANTFTLPYSMAGGASAEEAVSSGLTAVADWICEEIVANIYPMRITAKTTYELVLNQGGRHVRAGETLDVFRTAQKIKDVETGEDLGETEEMIARIRVTRVTPKMSFAQVVEGTAFSALPIGSIVRRTTAPATSAAQEPLGTTSPVKPTSNGVLPPW